MHLRSFFSIFVHLALIGLMFALAGGRISVSYRAHRHVSLSAINTKKCIKRVYFGMVRSESLVSKPKEIHSEPALGGIAWDLFSEAPAWSSVPLVESAIPESLREARIRSRGPPSLAHV